VYEQLGMKTKSQFLKYGWANFFKLLALKKLPVKEVQLSLGDGHGPLALCRHSMDYRLFSDIFLYDAYGTTLRAEPKYILDCGANIGISTRYFINRYPGAKIAAVEPDGRNFKILQSNLQGCDVKTYQMALHNKKGTLRLTNDSLSSYSRRFEQDGHGSQEIMAVPLQDLFSELQWPRIDLLKIDIEGGENAVFDTQDPWLSRVNVFVIEFHEYLKEGGTQAILSKIFSTGQYRIQAVGEHVFIERLQWIS
jgi:FkbM family methyltransferase